MSEKVERRGVVVWHRRDLRLRDNALYDGLEGREDVCLVCIYVFDDAHFERTPSTGAVGWDTTRVGPHMCRFTLEAVDDLRRSLRSLENDLMVFRGDGPDVVAQVSASVASAVGGPVEVRFASLAGSEEREEEERLQAKLQACGREMLAVAVEGVETLWHPSDLPATPEEWQWFAYDVGRAPPRAKQRKLKARSYKKRSGGVHDSNGAPVVMGEWRRAARDAAEPRKPSQAPTSLPPRPLLSSDSLVAESLETLPNLSELMSAATSPTYPRPFMGLDRAFVLGVVAAAVKQRPGPFQGGESAGLRRIDHFVTANLETAANRSAVDTGVDGSSKLSTYLALGCISPREVYAAAREARLGSRMPKGGEQPKPGKDENASWLASHLEIRDFFIYSTKSMGRALFRQHPLKAAKWGWVDPSTHCTDEWGRLALGQSGLPLIDAGMRELAATGYCSNRVRQNIASLLSRDLRFDWRCGAEMFQWMLVDHDVSSNWGNWSYFAGVGADPKDRHFRTCSQGMQHDPDGQYVLKWVPELEQALQQRSSLPRHALLHCPFLDTKRQLYCYPIVEKPIMQLTLHDATALQVLEDQAAAAAAAAAQGEDQDRGQGKRL